MNPTTLPMPLIHPTAIVHPRAELHATVQVQAYAVIGEHVRIGAQTVVGPHVTIDGWTEIGERNHFYNGAVIGLEPQDLKYRGAPSQVLIGDDNRIREYVTVNRATHEGEATVIGNGNLLMAYVHVAHNCTIQNQVVISNSVSLAGHVHIESRATIGGMVGIHQFAHIGHLAMVGGMSRIDRDVPPYMLIEGSPGRVRSLNRVGLERAGISDDSHADRLSWKLLNQAYRLLYRPGGPPFNQALSELQDFEDNACIRHLTTFLTRSVTEEGRRGPIPVARRRSGDGK